jgi:hypothetical protein
VRHCEGLSEKRCVTVFGLGKSALRGGSGGGAVAMAVAMAGGCGGCITCRCWMMGAEDIGLQRVIGGCQVAPGVNKISFNRSSGHRDHS